MAKASRFFATWFYLGLLRPAPGTWGTLGAIPLAFAMIHLGPMGYLAGTVLFSVFAIVVAQAYEAGQTEHDRSEIVIDEVAGFLVTMAWLPMTWQAWLSGFVLFRALDILKPPPIRWVDRKIKGGVGVVADDLLAGIIANIILQRLFT